MKALIFPIMLIIAVALGAGAWLLYSAPPGELEKLEIGGIHLPQPAPVKEFTLTSATDVSFDLNTLKGQWTFLFFGYTFCPDVCPLTLTKLSKIQQLLAEKNADQNTAYMFISVDPERDTPERLRDYTAHFSSKISSATGSRAEIDKLAKQFGIFYEIHEHEPSDKNYLVDHSSALILINPDAALQAVLTHPDQPETVVKDFLKIRSRYQEIANRS